MYVNPVFVKERNFAHCMWEVVEWAGMGENTLLVHMQATKALSAMLTGRLQLLTANCRLREVEKCQYKEWFQKSRICHPS